DLDYGVLFSDQHNFIGSAAWLFHTDLDLVPHLSFAIGPQVYAASLAQQSRSILAASIGGDARLELVPRYGIAVFGSAFYAPSVLIFGAANNAYDLTAGVQIRFAPRLMALGGYRWFRFSLQHSPDDTIQNSVFVGMRWDLGR
ncbi:MAG: YfaZ family outer membrane protein, partial [Steroidobacteraceae bacterium]